MLLLLLCLIFVFIIPTSSTGSGSNKSSPEKSSSNEFDWTSYLINSNDQISTSQHTTPFSAIESPVPASTAPFNQASVEDITSHGSPEMPRSKPKRKRKYDPNSWERQKAKFSRMTSEEKIFHKIHTKSKQQKYSNSLIDKIGYSSLHNARLHEYRALKLKGEANQEQLAYLDFHRQRATAHQAKYRKNRKTKGLPASNEKKKNKEG